jgi:CRISPR/Cas system-associated exonuclease Cas4 (RecB family)
MKSFGGTISASRIKTYLMCPFKYYLEYVLGVRKGDTFATSTGKLIHRQLERIAQGHRANWKKEYLWLYKKTQPHLLHKNWGAFCPDDPEFQIMTGIQHYHGPVAPLMTTNKKSPLWLFSEGAHMIQKVLDRDASPLDDRVLAVEQKFKLPIGDGIQITGIIDMVLETEPGVLEIRDWKTGNWVPKYEDAIDDAQLRLYDLAASILYPDYEIRLLTFDYLKKREYTFVVDANQREKNRKWIIGIAGKIDKDMNPNRITSSPHRNFKCKYMCDPDVCKTEWKLKDKKIK